MQLALARYRPGSGTVSGRYRSSSATLRHAFNEAIHTRPNTEYIAPRAIHPQEQLSYVPLDYFLILYSLHDLRTVSTGSRAAATKLAMTDIIRTPNVDPDITITCDIAKLFIFVFWWASSSTSNCNKVTRLEPDNAAVVIRHRDQLCGNKRNLSLTRLMYGRKEQAYRLRKRLPSFQWIVR